MAKAWKTLAEARDLVAGRLISRALAEQRLKEWLRDGKLEWRRKDATPDQPAEPFWSTPDMVDVDWEDSSARCDYVHPTKAAIVSAWVYGVEVGSDDLDRLLGPATEAGRWIAGEFERMREAGEIRKGMRIGDLERELAQRLKNAIVQRGLHAKILKPRSVGNLLRGMDLWPLK